MKLTGKNVLLTGAASGIGAELLRLLSSKAAHITCVDVNSAALQATISRLPPHTAQITPVIGDLSLPSTVEDMIAAGMAHMGGIDILIANAGIAYYEQLHDPNWQRIERIFQINVFSPIYAAQLMRQRCPEGGYTLVFVASAMAYIAVPGYSLYAATKAALDRFAEGYRFDVPSNTHLMLVYPVATRTNFFQNAGDQVPIIPPAQSPTVVAQAIVRGLQRNARRVYPHPVFRWLRFSMLGLTAMRYLTYWIGQRQFNEWKSKR